MPTITPTTRSWLYGVAFAVLVLAQGYGWLTDATLPLWVEVARAVLTTGSTGVAVAYRPTGPRASIQRDGDTATIGHADEVDHALDRVADHGENPELIDEGDVR